MALVKFAGGTFSLEPYESVLDCLLRNRQSIPYACKAGMCQACLVKAVGCEATEESSRWVNQGLRERGYTLACRWVPESDVQLSLPSMEDHLVRIRR